MLNTKSPHNTYVILSQHLLPEIRFTNNKITITSLYIGRPRKLITTTFFSIWPTIISRFIRFGPPRNIIISYTHSEPVTFLSERSRATPPPPPPSPAQRRFGTWQTDDRVQQPAEIWGRYFCYSPCPGTGR